MGKVKLHEIAKKIGVNSKEVVEKAIELGLDVKSHMSTVEEADAKKIESKFSGVKKEVKEKKEEPVIIRRAVIVSEDENEKIKQEKKTEKKQNRDVGFIERERKTDYNIVYRNKPNKPMTVSELFGKKTAPEKPKAEVKEEIKQEVKSQETVETVQEKPVVTQEKVQEQTERKSNNFAPQNKQYNNQNNGNRPFNRDNRNNNFGNIRILIKCTKGMNQNRQACNFSKQFVFAAHTGGTAAGSNYSRHKRRLLFFFTEEQHRMLLSGQW